MGNPTTDRPSVTGITQLLMEQDDRLRIEGELRQAVRLNQFELHYQPIVRLPSQTIQAFEALIRWRHPRRGLIPPAEFIPIAEESGLIIPIGQWVLRTACRQAAEWRTRYAAASELAVAVNLSAMQFAQTDLIAQVRSALEDCDLPARFLILEITETALMENAAHTVGALRALRNLGVRIDIDDFGAGYSSLAYLQNFPVDTMKIDRGFIANLEGAAANRQILRTIVDLAHSLRMSVTAEGVETPWQLDAVREMACDTSQGYWFSRPLPGAAAAELLGHDAPLPLRKAA